MWVHQIAISRERPLMSNQVMPRHDRTHRSLCIVKALFCRAVKILLPKSEQQLSNSEAHLEVHWVQLDQHPQEPKLRVRIECRTFLSYRCSLRNHQRSVCKYVLQFSSLKITDVSLVTSAVSEVGAMYSVSVMRTEAYLAALTCVSRHTGMLRIPNKHHGG